MSDAETDDVQNKVKLLNNMIRRDVIIVKHPLDDK